MTLRVGPAGWSYDDWEGIVYPRKKPRGFHALPYLARYFDCVELNSSFYAHPRADYAARWIELVADRPAFRFTAKLHRSFTHEPLPAEQAELAAGVDAFRSGIEPLRPRLAALLVQFPASFRAGPAGWRRLDVIREAFDDHELVTELRHRSWFEGPVLDELAARRYSLATIDLPPAPHHPPDGHGLPRFEGAIGYVRIHGRNRDTWFARDATRNERYDYLYGEGELAELVATTRAVADDHDQTFVVANNHFRGQAVANALDLLALLKEEEPLAPSELVAAYPHLRGRVRTEGQGELFG